MMQTNAAQSAFGLGGLYVVPCSQRKHPRLKYVPLQAQEAYLGAAFLLLSEKLKKARAKWCILSGLYGFLWPDTQIEWYDQKMDPDPQRPWDGEFDSITQRQYGHLVSAERITVLGSRLYVRSAEVMLNRAVEAPFAGMPIGKMLQAIRLWQPNTQEESGNTEQGGPSASVTG